jgi:hypothetical protein
MEVAVQFLSYFSDKQLGSLFLPFLPRQFYCWLAAASWSQGTAFWAESAPKPSRKTQGNADKPSAEVLKVQMEIIATLLS